MTAKVKSFIANNWFSICMFIGASLTGAYTFGYQVKEHEKTFEAIKTEIVRIQKDGSTPLAELKVTVRDHDHEIRVIKETTERTTHNIDKRLERLEGNVQTVNSKLDQLIGAFGIKKTKP
jgi:uncharacterized protein YhaN